MEMQYATSLPGTQPPGIAARQFSAAAVRLRHLQGESAIASVLHLRDEIDLSAHTASGAEFIALEKKETSAVSCSGSSLAAH